jgi:hypothetical protein
MTKRDRDSGKCVRTTAELLDAEIYYQDTQSAKNRHEYDRGDLVVRQRGNGSIRLVYPITGHGRGKATPFSFPSPYPRIGEARFPAAITDHEGWERDCKTYLRSIGWYACVLVSLALSGCATTGTGEWTQTDTNQFIIDGLLTVGDVLWLILAH